MPLDLLAKQVLPVPKVNRAALGQWGLKVRLDLLDRLALLGKQDLRELLARLESPGLLAIPVLWAQQVPKVTPEILVQLDHKVIRGLKVQLVLLDQKVLQVLRVRLDHRVRLDQLVPQVRRVRLVLKVLQVKVDNLRMRLLLLLVS